MHLIPRMEFLRRGHATRRVRARRDMRRTATFEQLGARCLMAGDAAAIGTYAAAADYDSPPAAIGSLVAGAPSKLGEAPAAAKGADANAAQGLRDHAADLPAADLIDGLRQLQDLEAIMRYADGVAALLFGTDEDVDGLTKAADLLGGQSDQPEAPWTPTVRDPAAIIAELLGGTAGAGGQASGRLGAHFQRMREGSGDESGGDGFERVGWAGNEHHYSYRSRDGRHSIEYHKTPAGVEFRFSHSGDRGGVTGELRIGEDGVERSRVTVHSGGGIIITETTYVPGGGSVTRTTIVDAQGVTRVGPDIASPPEEEEHLGEEHLEEEEGGAGGEEPGGDSQPSPTDDGRGWFSPLHPDAWATYLAWYTHQRGPDIYDPRDCMDGAEGSTTSTGARRVGPDAVIDTGDAGFIVSRPGGSGGTIHDPSCPIPVGPGGPGRPY